MKSLGNRLYSHRKLNVTKLKIVGIIILSRKIIKTIEDLHYSRLPVYKNNLDEIIGEEFRFWKKNDNS